MLYFHVGGLFGFLVLEDNSEIIRRSFAGQPATPAVFSALLGVERDPLPILVFDVVELPSLVA